MTLFVNQQQLEKLVLDVNSIFEIKNPNFIIGFKKMTKLVRYGPGLL